MLEKGGTLAIEQLTEALAATAKSQKFPDELAHGSLKRCVEQVGEMY